MTIRVERTFEIAAPPDKVWEFIADPAKRASAISVVDSWEQDGDEFVWHIELPLPLVSTTVPVRTREIERTESERVKFVGRSQIMNVTGEHVLKPTNTGTQLTNHFIVDGRLPGVEQFFNRRLDDELINLKTAIQQDLDISVESID